MSPKAHATGHRTARGVLCDAAAIRQNRTDASWRSTTGWTNTRERQGKGSLQKKESSTEGRGALNPKPFSDIWSTIWHTAVSDTSGKTRSPWTLHSLPWSSTSRKCTQRCSKEDIGDVRRIYSPMEVIMEEKQSWLRHKGNRAGKTWKNKKRGCVYFDTPSSVAVKYLNIYSTKIWRLVRFYIPLYPRKESGCAFSR